MLGGLEPVVELGDAEELEAERGPPRSRASSARPAARPPPALWPSTPMRVGVDAELVGGSCSHAARRSSPRARPGTGARARAGTRPPPRRRRARGRRRSRRRAPSRWCRRRSRRRGCRAAPGTAVGRSSGVYDAHEHLGRALGPGDVPVLDDTPVSSTSPESADDVVEALAGRIDVGEVVLGEHVDDRLELGIERVRAGHGPGPSRRRTPTTGARPSSAAGSRRRSSGSSTHLVVVDGVVDDVDPWVASRKAIARSEPRRARPGTTPRSRSGRGAGAFIGSSSAMRKTNCSQWTHENTSRRRSSVIIGSSSKPSTSLEVPTEVGAAGLVEQVGGHAHRHVVEPGCRRDRRGVRPSALLRVAGQPGHDHRLAGDAAGGQAVQRLGHAVERHVVGFDQQVGGQPPGSSSSSARSNPSAS